MKKSVSILLLPALLFFAVAGNCQVPDSIPPSQTVDFQQDTVIAPTPTVNTTAELTVEESDKPGFLYRTFKADYPNPNKALYLSLAIPGGGQFYNRRWWKIPIVYGGYAALIYSARYNGSNYRDLRDAVIAEYAGEPHKFSDTGLNLGDLERLRDQFDKRRQLSYIGMFALHLVQAAEAFVDCHLKTFDVSDDLSLQVKPAFQATPQSFGLTPGLGLALTIK